jgi:hypothetical protein
MHVPAGVGANADGLVGVPFRHRSVAIVQ